MVGICGVKIVDPVLDGELHHLFHLVVVRVRLVPANDRQAHQAEAERRDLFTVKIIILHISLPLEHD